MSGSYFVLFSSGLLRSLYENNVSLFGLFCSTFLFLEQCSQLSLSDEIGCTFFDIDNFSIIPKYLLFDINNLSIILKAPTYRLSIISFDNIQILQKKQHKIKLKRLKLHENCWKGLNHHRKGANATLKIQNNSVVTKVHNYLTPDKLVSESLLCSLH